MRLVRHLSSAGRQEGSALPSLLLSASLFPYIISTKASIISLLLSFLVFSYDFSLIIESPFNISSLLDSYFSLRKFMLLELYATSLLIRIHPCGRTSVSQEPIWGHTFKHQCFSDPLPYFHRLSLHGFGILMSECLTTCSPRALHVPLLLGTEDVHAHSSCSTPSSTFHCPEQSHYLARQHRKRSLEGAMLTTMKHFSSV